MSSAWDWCVSLKDFLARPSDILKGSGWTPWSRQSSKTLREQNMREIRNHRTSKWRSLLWTRIVTATKQRERLDSPVAHARIASCTPSDSSFQNVPMIVHSIFHTITTYTRHKYQSQHLCYLNESVPTNAEQRKWKRQVHFRMLSASFQHHQERNYFPTVKLQSALDGVNFNAKMPWRI